MVLDKLIPDGHKVVVVGLDKSGKSAMLHRMINGTHKDDMAPTNGVAVHQMNYKNTPYSVYDLSGHQTNRANWEHHYDDAEVIYIYPNFRSQKEQIPCFIIFKI